MTRHNFLKSIFTAVMAFFGVKAAKKIVPRRAMTVNEMLIAAHRAIKTPSQSHCVDVIYHKTPGSLSKAEVACGMTEQKRQEINDILGKAEYELLLKIYGDLI